MDSRMKNRSFRRKSRGLSLTRWTALWKFTFLEKFCLLLDSNIQQFLVPYFFAFLKIPHFLVTIRNSLDSQHVVTHSVSPRDGIRKYSYPFTFEFAMKEGARYPELFVEAVSFGFFNNRRIEGTKLRFSLDWKDLGYGYGMIPEEAGKHDVEVKCWRPQMGVQDE